jgi:signal transduction histidine kinase
MSQTTSGWENRQEVAGYAAGCVLAGLAVTMLLGWLWQLFSLPGGPDPVPMDPVTTLCCLLAGVSLAAARWQPRWSGRRLGWVVFGIAALSLTRHLTGFDPDWMGWPAPGGTAVRPFPGGLGMPPVTAFGFVFGGATLALRSHPRWQAPALTLGGLTALTAVAALLGAAWDLPDVPGFDKATLPSVFALAVLAGPLLVQRRLSWPDVTLRGVLGALVLSALVPPLVFMALQARRAAQEQLVQIEQVGQSLTDRAGGGVDRLLSERMGLLKALSVAPALRQNDLGSFYEHAKAALESEDGIVVVTDSSASPRLVLSTAVPFGATLPAASDPETRTRALASGKIEVSGVFMSPFTGRPVVSLVMLAPGTSYVVRLTVRPGGLNDQLAAMAPPGWIIGIADRDGILVGRSQDPDKWVGRSASMPAWILARQKDTGWERTNTLEGLAVYFKWQRLTSGWTVLAALNERDLDLVTRKETKTVSIAALATGVLGLLFAVLTAVMLGRPLARLSAAAAAFGRGEEIRPIVSRIREIDDVVAALAAGAKARAEAEAALRAREEDSRNFTYAASHDLKAPTSTLKMIFSQLRTRLDAADIATSRELVRIGLGSLERMSELLARLVDYSRIVDKQPVSEDIELSALIDQVIADLQHQVVETGAVISVGDLPVIRGDQVHFRALFQNLLSNAMKYRTADVRPQIAVSALQDPTADVVLVSVKDNGIGVAPQFHARVFEMFQRLHTQDDVPGTGLGLFICMRIAKIYGGTIRIRSDPAQGAEFIVELPQSMRVR